MSVHCKGFHAPIIPIWAVTGLLTRMGQEAVLRPVNLKLFPPAQLSIVQPSTIIKQTLPFPLCLVLNPPPPGPRHPIFKLSSTLPWKPTKSERKRIFSTIPSPRSSSPVILPETFSPSYSNKYRASINPGVPMNDGLSGSIPPYTSSLLSPRQLEQLASYDMRLSEICTLIFISQAFSPATVVFAGIGVLLSVCIPHYLACAIVTQTFLRLQKMFGKARTPLSTCLNASKCSSDVSRCTQKSR